jgi:hypothetical protein
MPLILDLLKKQTQQHAFRAELLLSGRECLECFEDLSEKI